MSKHELAQIQETKTDSVHSLSKFQVQKAKAELAKVFNMSAQGIEIEMFSMAIDAVWHEMLQEPENYKKFCIESCGGLVGHQETKGYGIMTFVESYEARFGKLDNIWFIDQHGVFNHEAWEQYLETGLVEASWKCGPTHGCMVQISPD